jgi:predicted ABC-type ATPase
VTVAPDPANTPAPKAAAQRPVLFVLAGVNGAGKSSIGGHLLQRAGLAWFNPDTHARELIALTSCSQADANGAAWQEGLRRLDEALVAGRHHAFETTLGGDTIAERLRSATASHDVLIWYCGLASPEQHIARVRARVAAGGHDIPEAKIHERWQRSRLNLIALLPHVARVQVYDNSANAAPGTPVPDPTRVADIVAGRLMWPTLATDLAQTPEWARAVLGAVA